MIKVIMASNMFPCGCVIVGGVKSMKALMFSREDFLPAMDIVSAKTY